MKRFSLFLVISLLSALSAVAQERVLVGWSATQLTTPTDDRPVSLSQEESPTTPYPVYATCTIGEPTANETIFWEKDLIFNDRDAIDVVFNRNYSGERVSWDYNFSTDYLQFQQNKAMVTWARIDDFSGVQTNLYSGQVRVSYSADGAAWTELGILTNSTRNLHLAPAQVGDYYVRLEGATSSSAYMSNLTLYQRSRRHYSAYYYAEELPSGCDNCFLVRF